MDEIYTRLLDKSELDEEIDEPSEIQQFFNGQTIFLTGCTGFVGKVFVEKLLRGCPDIKKLYLLVRPKKLSIDERMKNYFDDVIFERMKNENPNYLSKISIMEGDLMKDNLGLSEKDKMTLIKEATLFYHNASNVKFDEKINVSIRVNVMGTKYALDLAKECKHLFAFAYISTAYSHCYQQHIEEKFYRPPGDMKMIMDVMTAADSTPGGIDEKALKSVLGQWPNAYAFTKSTAEYLVEEYAKKVSFACMVFRPSIVLSSYLEPIRGWCGNINGPVGVILGAGLGFIHALHEGFYPVDYVPVDMCANAMIATTWDAVVNKKSEKEGLVYNYGTSVVNQLTLQDLERKSFNMGTRAPTIHMMGPYYTIYTKCIWHYWLLHVLLHLSTALFADAVLICTGKKPQVVSSWMLLTKNMKSLLYFSNGNWRIQVHRMQTVWNRMNRRDAKLFYCDLRTLNWDDYFHSYWTGLRVYVLKDSMETREASVRKFKMLGLIPIIFYYVVHISIIYFVVRYLYSVYATFI